MLVRLLGIVGIGIVLAPLRTCRLPFQAFYGTFKAVNKAKQCKFAKASLLFLLDSFPRIVLLASGMQVNMCQQREVKFSGKREQFGCYVQWDAVYVNGEAFVIPGIDILYK